MLSFCSFLSLRLGRLLQRTAPSFLSAPDYISTCSHPHSLLQFFSWSHLRLSPFSTTAHDITNSCLAAWKRMCSYAYIHNCVCVYVAGGVRLSVAKVTKQDRPPISLVAGKILEQPLCKICLSYSILFLSLILSLHFNAFHCQSLHSVGATKINDSLVFPCIFCLCPYDHLALLLSSQLDLFIKP